MTIYGECVSVSDRTLVTISDLGGMECQIEPAVGTRPVDGLLDLWIGAIGPLLVTAETTGGTRYRARFREPLDDRIIAHFAEA